MPGAADATAPGFTELLTTLINEEPIMARKYIDCREFPSESKCTVTIAADSEKELLEIALQHAVAVHGHKDTPEFRGQLKKAFKDGAPPA
jgi:predicted small metal-binding protein